MKADTEQALMMLRAFESVGVHSFDVTMTNSEGEKTGFRKDRQSSDLQSTIGRGLAIAIDRQENVIVRPIFKEPQLIQLDDLDAAKVERVAPHAFMILCTSPGNYQAWVAVENAPEDLARRLRKGAGADKSASGATRVSGSVNFKAKYGPNFPLVTITETKPGHVTTAAQLTEAGIVAAREEPQPPRTASRFERRGSRRLTWPSYQRCLDGAPITTSGNESRSLADFTWCRTAIEWGWGTEATAGQLMEVSTKAKENGAKYATQTATRAAESVQRQPYRAKSTPGHQGSSRRGPDLFTATNPPGTR